MGQKVNPHGLRVGVIKGWDTKWYASKKDFADLLYEDYKLRKMLKERLYAAGISKIEIERAANKVKVNIYTGKPGIVIGKNGENVNVLKNDISKFTNKEAIINIVEIKSVDKDAQLIAESITAQLEKRISFRKAMKTAISRAMKPDKGPNIKGIKIKVSGRLNGNEIAASEAYSEGNTPLHTLRADIEYGTATARTTYGAIGVKVWVYKGEVLPKAKAQK
ncbi:MAG: 30S ribosomal protein S3 [Clostridiales bacterium]|nr:30S ribosomal protein S3 [Clostridiales bacterium]